LHKQKDNKVDWTISSTNSNISQPDLRYFTTSYIIDPVTQTARNFVINDSIGSSPLRFYRDIRAWNGDLSLNYTYKRAHKPIWRKIKWGLRGTVKYQVFEEQQLKYQTDFVPYTGEAVSNYINPDNYIQWDDVNNTIIPGIYIENNFDSTNNYLALEGIIAGYFMSEFHLGKNTILTAGLRTEITGNGFVTIDSDSADLGGGSSYPVFLPAVSLRHELQKDMFLRASYAGTVARPTLRELSAFTSFDYIGDYTVTGDLRLAEQPTLLHNVDFRWEAYPSNREVVSIGAFFKYISNPIELESQPNAPNQLFRYRRLPWAYVLGLELELKQGLGILGEWGEDFMMGANLGYIYSQAKIPNQQFAMMLVDNPTASKFRPLFGQSPYVLNFLLNYNNKDLGLDVNASFHISGKKIVYVLLGNTPNIYEQPRGVLNLNVAKHFNDLYHIRLSIDNILDAKLVQIQSFKGRTYSYRQYSLGRNIWLGFSYLIK